MLTMESLINIIDFLFSSFLSLTCHVLPFPFFSFLHFLSSFILPVSLFLFFFIFNYLANIKAGRTSTYNSESDFTRNSGKIWKAESLEIIFTLQSKFINHQTSLCLLIPLTFIIFLFFLIKIQLLIKNKCSQLLVLTFSNGWNSIIKHTLINQSSSFFVHMILGIE